VGIETVVTGGSESVRDHFTLASFGSRQEILKLFSAPVTPSAHPQQGLLPASFR